MSRRVVVAPLAVTCEGDVLLNLWELLDDRAREHLLREVVRSKGQVFIGVRLTPAELRVALGRVDNAVAEAVGRLVGQRRRRLVTRSNRTSRS